MEGSMTAKNINNIVYFLNTEAIHLIAVTTDSYFEECNNTSYQIQISDLDVEISDEDLNNCLGLIPVDVGGISVTNAVKDFLISIGCKEDLFRTMTVNGKQDLLWQIKAPGKYEIINKELNPSKNSTVYRGPIDDISLELKGCTESSIGCLLGREDYQELVFSKEIYEGLITEYDVSDYFIAIPLYEDSLINIINGEFDLVPNQAFDNCNSEYIELLRSSELMALLKYANKKSIFSLGHDTYKLLKGKKLSMELKKESIKLYKDLKSMQAEQNGT